MEPMDNDGVFLVQLAESQAKAFSNPVVTDNISRFLSAKDISQARLASVIFHGSFTPAMQRSSRMRPGPLTLSAICPVPNCATCHHHLLPSYVDLMNDSRLPPLANNFNLQQLNLTLGEELPSQFFHRLGANIRSLCLNQAYSESTDMSIIRRILFQWTPNLVHLELRPLLYNDSAVVWSNGQDKISPPKEKLHNLKSLTIATAKTEPDPECEQLVADLVAAAPRLKELRLERGAWATKAALSTLANREGGCAALKTLAVNNLGMEELTFLTLAAAGNGLHLHEFETSGWNGTEVLASYLEQFLRLRAPVLQTLRIEVENPSFGSSVTLKLSRMERLETLRITRKSRDTQDGRPPFTLDLHFETSDLGTTCPKLKSLQFCNCTGVITGHCGVSELTMGSASAPFNLMGGKVLEKLGQSFPSVTHFTLVLPDLSVITSPGLTWARWTSAWKKLRVFRIEVPPSGSPFYSSGEMGRFAEWTSRDQNNVRLDKYPCDLDELRLNPKFGRQTLLNLTELSLTEFCNCVLFSNSKCIHKNSKIRRYN